ncbi:MAG: arylsulfatase [Rikenellaceae bacterium]
MEATAQEQPNVIFILADDMGIGDLGCYGQQQIKTPNIDALAANGLLFTHHYSGSTVSAPSRCALMTGKHTGNGYIRGNKGNGEFDLDIPDEEFTVAELMQQSGYTTMCVGKWGLGGANREGSPTNQGFDYFCGYLSQGAAHRYYPKYIYENDTRLPLDGEYSHYTMMRKGLEFIDKNADKPIFAYFAVTPPHADLDHPDMRQYEGKFDETPYINNSGKGFKSQPTPRAAYAAMVSEFDRSVGQIVDKLKERGIFENTIIIVSSDNGNHSVGGHDPEYFNSNGDFRGIKRDLYEGGVRAPFVVSWAAQIEGAQTTDHISTFWDFLPTMAELTGQKAPKDIDGISYFPQLLGTNRGQKEHRIIYFEFFEQGGKQSIMTRDGWKLVRLNMSKPEKLVEELYYLPTDIGEERNVIADNPKIADKLRKMAMSERSESDIFKWIK